MRNRHLPAVLVFIAFVFGLTLLSLFKPSDEISELERRNLAQAPEVSFDRVFDGQFTQDYMVYLQDQMLFRDEFRFIKSLVERNLLLKPENNGVYVIGGNIYDKFYGIQDRLIDRAATVINEIAASIDSDHIYLSVIPSKAQMLDRTRYLLSDQNDIASTLAQNVDALYVDLMDLATPANEHLYYITDPHWTTQGAIHAYELLAEAMGYQPVREYEFEVATDSYIGSNYGKAASEYRWSFEAPV